MGVNCAMPRGSNTVADQNIPFTGPNTSVPDDSVVVQVNTTPDIKPSLLPMETDVISSEEDDILARESPESEHKSPPSSHEDFMEVCRYESAMWNFFQNQNLYIM